MSSCIAEIGLARRISYAASKGAVLSMTKSMQVDLAPHGIRVNALAPGLVETRFSEALFQNRQVYERLMANVPLGRHGQPADLVGAAIFLASEASAYVTGQVLIVDGGGRV